MSEVAFAHAVCGRTERAGAFVRSVRLLTTSNEGLGSTSSARGRAPLVELGTDDVEAWVARHYADDSQLAFTFGARLPSGREAVLTACVTGPSHPAAAGAWGGDVTLSLERSAFAAVPRRPRFLPWPAGMTAALLEQELVTDVMWMMKRWRRAVGASESPIALSWGTEFPAAADAFAVGHAQKQHVVRDYAVEWLAARGVRPVTELFSLETSQLEQLVRGAPSGVVSEKNSRWKGDEVCALLRRDEKQVCAAVEALAAPDRARVELAHRVGEARELLRVAADTVPADPDWEKRRALFPEAPLWQLASEDDGSFIVASAPFLHVAGFYESLALLLL